MEERDRECVQGAEGSAKDSQRVISTSEESRDEANRMTQRTMQSYPIEDGTIELLAHEEGKTYGLKIYTADYNSPKKSSYLNFTQCV